MKAYIGAKVIQAEPATRESTGPGGLVAVLDGYKVVYPDGYTSWSPKATFEQAYRELHPFERDLVEGASW